MRISALATALVLTASTALAGPPVQTEIDPADLFIIVPRGSPSAQTHYIKPQTMADYFLSITGGISAIATPSLFWNPTYYSNPATGVVNRFNRVFIGEATLGSSDIPVTTPDWLEALLPATTGVSQLASVNAIGALGITGASRTSDYRTWTGASSAGSEGVLGVGYNDDTTAGTPIATGADLRGIRKLGVAGITLGYQAASYNQTGASVVDIDPVSGLTGGTIMSSLITTSTDPAYTENISALAVLGNGGSALARKGQVFLNGALDTSIGQGGGGIAQEFGEGMSLRWVNSVGAPEAEIYGTAAGFTIVPPLFVGAQADIIDQVFIHSVGKDASVTVTANSGTWGEIDALNNAGNATLPLVVNRFGGNVLLGTSTDCGSKACVTGALDVSAGFKNNGVLLFSPTPPTIASGGCTTGSAQSVSASNGSAAFEITIGGATCGSTITLTMTAAPHNWVCDAHNITNPATNVLDMTGAASTTAVVLTNFVRTTGVAGNFTGADKLAVKCLPY